MIIKCGVIPFLLAVVILHFYYVRRFYAGLYKLNDSDTIISSLQIDQDEKQQRTSKQKYEEILSKHHDVCVVGSGLSGSVIAERYANQLHKKVLIIERRSHIGGNCYDYIDDETKIRVSKYGAHLFHTNSERVWDYIQQYSKWTKYEHRVLGLVNGKHVPIPVNIDTVNALFDLNIQSSEEMDRWLEKEQIHYDHEPTNSEEMTLSRVGPRLYDLIFKPYTYKQWARYPTELGPEVTARIPVRNDRNDKYFPNDKYQVLPTNGYTKFFENMIMNHTLIDVLIDTDYFEIKDRIRCDKL